MTDIESEMLIWTFYQFMVFQALMILGSFVCGWLVGYIFFLWKVHWEFEKEMENTDEK